MWLQTAPAALLPRIPHRRRLGRSTFASRWARGNRKGPTGRAGGECFGASQVTSCPRQGEASPSSTQGHPPPHPEPAPGIPKGPRTLARTGPGSCWDLAMARSLPAGTSCPGNKVGVRWHLGCRHQGPEPLAMVDLSRQVPTPQQPAKHLQLVCILLKVWLGVEGDQGTLDMGPAKAQFPGTGSAQ